MKLILLCRRDKIGKHIIKIHKSAIYNKCSGKQKSSVVYMLGQGFSHLVVCGRTMFLQCCYATWILCITNPVSLITSDLFFCLSYKISLLVSAWGHDNIKTLHVFLIPISQCHIENSLWIGTEVLGSSSLPYQIKKAPL